MPFENVKITIIRSDRKTLAVQIKNGEIIARAPKRMKEKDIFAFIGSKSSWIENHLAKQQQQQQVLQELPPLTRDEINALTKKAAEVLPQRVAFYAPKIGVTYSRITIRCQRTRWGSCTSQGNLNFNCLLMLLPDDIINSVVVHELCHRKHMDHSKAFYAEIEKVFPDYPACHKWLNENGRLFLGRLP